MKTDVQEIAETIGIPVSDWPGNCYGVAVAILSAGLAPEGAELRYGHWLGPVSSDCPVERFKNGAAFQRHGWLELPSSAMTSGCICGHEREAHGGDEPTFLQACRSCDCMDFEADAFAQVIDPTRWVFEGKPPYIFQGVSDYYDHGGNAWRALTERPLPPYCEGDALVVFDTWKYSRDAHEFVIHDLFHGRTRVTLPMAQWLAGLALPRLGVHARAIFQTIADLDNGRAWIPIDNWRFVIGEASVR